MAATVGLTSVLFNVGCLAVVWVLRVSRGGPRVRALCGRWAVGGLVACAAVTGWVASGIVVLNRASDVWQGAWVGGSAVLWLAYYLALARAVRPGRRQMAAARAADAGLAG
ncbi:MAG TPA: hypothetical protein VH092_10180 [Urbifossiella sp.]|jgi:hypothetical protein|nr:hypothetical protein [Urbifossiella sp.]